MQIPAEVTVNANSAQCIRAATHWGYDAIHNVCADTVTRVPWGGMDYVGAVFMSVMAVAIVLAAFAFVAFFVQEIFGNGF